MKKTLFLLFLIFIISSSFAKKKQSPVDNTFSCLVQNESDFEITIDGIEIKPKQSETHKFPLHSAALYDGWTVEYKIPLLDFAYYVHSEKKSLVDNQKALKIENPAINSAFACYVVIKNLSNDAVQIQNSLRGSILPCYSRGAVNGRRDLLEPVYSIAAGTSAVICLEKEERLFVANEHNGKNCQIQIQFAKGYAYEYIFDSENLVLQDARPLHLLKEKLWHKEFDDSQVIRAVQQADGKIYLMGTEILSDKKENKYSSGFVQCLDRNGTELWKQSYAVKGKDTYLYDMALLDKNTIGIVGQLILDNELGLFLAYDLSGNLKKAVKIQESVGFEKIRKSTGGAFIIGGYDTEENPVNYSIESDFEIKRLNLVEAISSSSELIQSVNAEVYDDDGNLYSAGESAEMEKPVACVVKSTKDKKNSVLYMATEPNSYITNMKINRKTGELVICGSLGGNDSSGNGGKPFIRCIDSNSGKLFWESIIQKNKYEIAVKIASCDDYGFVVLLANADGDGNLASPCALVRTNAVGKVEF